MRTRRWLRLALISLVLAVGTLVAFSASLWFRCRSAELVIVRVEDGGFQPFQCEGTIK